MLQQFFSENPSGEDLAATYLTGRVDIYGNLLDRVREGINLFLRALYHKIGHAVNFRLLLPQDWPRFYDLYERSFLADEFAREYGKWWAGYEDLATLFEAYATNSAGIVAKAGTFDEKTGKLKFPNLFEKLKMVVELFKIPGTNKVYIYKVDENGNFLNSNGEIIHKREELDTREIGPAGLPLF